MTKTDELEFDYYFEARKSDAKPVFLLTEIFFIDWQNYSAEKFSWPAQYFQDFFMSQSLQKNIRNALKYNDFFVLRKFSDEWILLLTYIDIPSRQAYFEVSLWPRSADMLPVNKLVNHFDLPNIMAALVLAHAGHKSVMQISRITNLYLKLVSLDRHRFDSPTLTIDADSFFESLASCIKRVLALNGIMLKYDKNLDNIDSLTQPEALTDAIGLLISQMSSKCLPGDVIIMNVEDCVGCFKVDFAMKPAGKKVTSQKLFDMDSDETILAKKIVRWMGGNLEENILKLPRKFIAEKDNFQPFLYKKNLICILSAKICTEKLGPFSLDDDYTQNWRFFYHYDFNLTFVSSCIDSIQERLERFDYRNLYGWNAAKNFSLLDSFRFDKELEIYLSGLSKDGYLAALSSNNQTATATVEALSSLYGLTAAHMAVPNLLLQVIAGTLPTAMTDASNVAPAAYLVFYKLVRDMPDFETDNAAFSVCKEQVPYIDSSNLSALIESGAVCIQKNYFDQSKPISQKIGNNLTLLRLRAKLPLREAARRAGMYFEKLQALESGEVTGVTYFELDRLCHVYREENVPGLLIGGYVLVHLWRNNFLEFVIPYKSFPKNWVNDCTEKRPFYDLLERENLTILLDSLIGIEHMNKTKTESGLEFYRENFPIINLYRKRLVLWVDGCLYQISKPLIGEGTVYLFGFYQDLDITVSLAVFETGENPVNAYEIGGQIKKILENNRRKSNA